MSNWLSYKNYRGSIEYSKEDKCLFGKVEGVKSLLSYEGDSLQELEENFKSVIDEYLADCKERGLVPEGASGLYEEVLDSADKSAEENDRRYTHDQVFSNLRMRIDGVITGPDLFSANFDD